MSEPAVDKILLRVQDAFANEARPEHFTDYEHCCECFEHFNQEQKKLVWDKLRFLQTYHAEEVVFEPAYNVQLGGADETLDLEISQEVVHVFL